MKTEEIVEVMSLMERMAQVAGQSLHPDEHIRLMCRKTASGFVWIRTARATGPLAERTFSISREQALAFLVNNEERRQWGRKERAKASLSMSSS